MAALALDDAHSTLFFADPLNFCIRALDTSGATMHTIATGLAANALALQGGVLHASDALGNRLVQVPTGTGVPVTELGGVSDPDAECATATVLQDCATAPCRPAIDAAGKLFVSGLLCGAGMGSHVPGILRMDGTSPVRVAGVSAPGVDAVAAQLGFPSAPPLAFNRGGNPSPSPAACSSASTESPPATPRSPPAPNPASPGRRPWPSVRAGTSHIADTGNASVRRSWAWAPPHPATFA